METSSGSSDDGGGRLETLVGGLLSRTLGRDLDTSAPSLAELLETSEFWDESKAVDEDEAVEEMELLRIGGPGAVRERKMQESVQAWLLSKRASALAGLRLHRLADSPAMHGGRADALLEDSLRILQRKTDLLDDSAAAYELQALKLEMHGKQRALDEALKRVASLEIDLENERAKVKLFPTESVAAFIPRPDSRRHLTPDNASSNARPSDDKVSPTKAIGVGPGGRASEEMADMPAVSAAVETVSDPSACSAASKAPAEPRLRARTVIAAIRKSKLVDVVVPEHLAGPLEQMRHTVGRAVDRWFGRHLGGH